MAASTLTLKAQVRDARGKEWAKKARAAGKVPGVVYGAGKANVAFEIDAHEFKMARQSTHGDSVLMHLEIAGAATEPVFIKDLQRDPLSWEVIHADFLRVDLTKEIVMAVQLRVVGSTPLGVKDGGLLEQLRHEVHVAATPNNIPPHVDIDCSNLDVAQTMHVSDLPALSGVRYTDDPDTPLFTIVSKAKLEKQAEAQAATPVQEAPEGAAPAAAAAPAAGAKEEKKEEKKK